MRNTTYKQEKKHTLVVSGVALFLLLLLFGVFTKATVGVLMKERTARIQREAIEDKIAILEERKIALKHDLRKLETERGVEEEIREKFRVVKEGEQLVILVDEDNEASAIKALPKKRGWFARIFNWF